MIHGINFLGFSYHEEIVFNILSYLAPADFTSLAQTSQSLKSYVGRYRGTQVTESMPRVTFAPTPSMSSAHADEDSLASTDTEMTSSPHEDDCHFQLNTAELAKKLNGLPKRAAGSDLDTLPVELQLMIFGYLDKIDSCCLGLSAPNLYVLFREIHGMKMKLSTGRDGPNPLEYAWRLESSWEVVGKQQCQQCGMFRCQLHEHIKSWMPKDLEYCSMKRNFGIRAPDSANENCYRGKPSKPHRCGRHPLRTTSTHQDDASFGIPSPPPA